MGLLVERIRIDPIRYLLEITDLDRMICLVAIELVVDIDSFNISEFRCRELLRLEVQLIPQPEQSSKSETRCQAMKSKEVMTNPPERCSCDNHRGYAHDRQS